MSTSPTNTHIAIRESLYKRILAGEWGLGDRIPDEVDLAAEYGCARTTMNRALRALADDGLIIRKRKGGTRVNPWPIRSLTLPLPSMREQVESSGSAYRHQTLEKSLELPPSSIRTRLRLEADAKAYYIETMHLSDERPHAFETRWVNADAFPEVGRAPLDEVSINEWLLKHSPYTTGEATFSAVNADDKTATALEADAGAALFTFDFTTRTENSCITTARLYFRVGHQVVSKF
ncbi:MAG: UTRA domain-containing protein [Pseudomonadota bacterium]